MGIAQMAKEWEHMNSVPSSMYWCCIYLTGEWANVDFSFAGSRLSIFFVFFGITLFSIPTAIIVESIQASIQYVAQEDADVTVALLNRGTIKAASEIVYTGLPISKVPSQTAGQEIEMSQFVMSNGSSQESEGPPMFTPGGGSW